MAGRQNNPQKEFHTFFESNPFAKMMQKMMDQKEGYGGFSCSDLKSFAATAAE